jgi:hypothetical protein
MFTYYPSTEPGMKRIFVPKTRIVIWRDDKSFEKNVSISNSIDIPHYLRIPLYAFRIKSLKIN